MSLHETPLHRYDYDAMANYRKRAAPELPKEFQIKTIAEVFSMTERRLLALIRLAQTLNPALFGILRNN